MADSHTSWFHLQLQLTRETVHCTARVGCYQLRAWAGLGAGINQLTTGYNKLTANTHCALQCKKSHAGVLAVQALLADRSGPEYNVSQVGTLHCFAPATELQAVPQCCGTLTALSADILQSAAAVGNKLGHQRGRHTPHSLISSCSSEQ